MPVPRRVFCVRANVRAIIGAFISTALMLMCNPHQTEPTLPKHLSRQALLIAGIGAALVFLGGVASNLVASDLQTMLKPYRVWVWVICAIAFVVTVVSAIVAARRRDDSATAETTRNVNARGKRNAAIGGNVKGSTIVTGDDNVISGSDEGDFVARDKHIHIHQTSRSPANALHQVPPPPADFIGREDELRELLAAIQHGGITISGLKGLGGIGKTALALKLVEQLKLRYADAQIFLDLKGASTQPLTVSEALAHVLRAYRPTATLPESETEMRGFYLSVLDGQRALLLMDNAASTMQVEPLIPPGSCLLLVTSRFHITLPGLAAKNLDTLTPVDARELLLTIAPRIGEWADEIVELCGRLPLALRLAATAMVKYVNLQPTDYVRRLRDQQQRLQLIEASLSLSYELLSEELRERWRWLAVFADTFAGYSAADVWDVEIDQAHDTLGELIAVSLVEWNETSERYRLHDLARLFANAKLSGEERAAAQKRFAIHYRILLAATNQVYLEGGESLLRALEVFDLEWGNIQTGHAWVATHADAADPDVTSLGMDYPMLSVHVLYLRQHPRERIKWLEIALAATRRFEDRANEGIALGNLGLAYWNLGETRHAIQFYEQYLTIAREVGNREGEGIALVNLGSAYLDLDETRRAIQFYEQGLLILREIGDRRNEGVALGNLGSAYNILGNNHQAIQFHEQNLAIFREIGDRTGEGRALGNLGIIHEDLGEIQRAIQFYEQALLINRETGDRNGEGTVLWNMSLVLDRLGDRTRAIEFAEQSLIIKEQIEDPKAAEVRAQLAEWREETRPGMTLITRIRSVFIGVIRGRFYSGH